MKQIGLRSSKWYLRRGWRSGVLKTKSFFKSDTNKVERKRERGDSVDKNNGQKIFCLIIHILCILIYKLRTTRCGKTPIERKSKSSSSLRTGRTYGFMETVNNKVSAPTLKNEWLRGEKEMLREKWFGARSMPSYDKKLSRYAKQSRRETRQQKMGGSGFGGEISHYVEDCIVSNEKSNTFEKDDRPNEKNRNRRSKRIIITDGEWDSVRE